MKNRKSNRINRRVSVVMSDQWHTLHLVEAKADVRRFEREDGTFGFRVDKNALEEFAQSRLRERIDPEQRITSFDMVGILVADDTIEHKGRITWADEIEVSEAVTV